MLPCSSCTAVAQWIEQHPPKMWVVGSIPARRATNGTDLEQITWNKSKSQVESMTYMT